MYRLDDDCHFSYIHNSEVQPETADILGPGKSLARDKLLRGTKTDILSNLK